MIKDKLIRRAVFWIKNHNVWNQDELFLTLQREFRHAHYSVVRDAIHTAKIQMQAFD